MTEQTNGAPTERDVQREVRPKHSDGPWSVKEVPGSDGHLSIVDSKGLFVARVHRRGEAVTPEARANAHLVSAATELLKAARRALAVLKATGESVRSGNALGALDAAITKAEGR